MLHAHLAALALATTTLAASGCGGSSSQTQSTNPEPATTASASTPVTSSAPASATSSNIAAPTVASGKPLTRAQWVIRGDAICARTNAQLTATTAKTLSEFSHKLPEAVAYYQTELAALSKLVPPTSKANDWQEFLTGTLQISQNTAKLAEIAQARQITLHEPELFAVNKIREVITRVAKRDGFKDCSEI